MEEVGLPLQLTFKLFFPEKTKRGPLKPLLCNVTTLERH
jgi:hypothetical protein